MSTDGFLTHGQAHNLLRQTYHAHRLALTSDGRLMFDGKIAPEEALVSIDALRRWEREVTW